MEEIHAFIKSMNGNKVSGPDGYNGLFFLHYWDIIEFDLFDVISEFFAGAELPRSQTSTLLVHVPKVPNPTSFMDLRPISLGNFSNKIIARLFVATLTSILPNIISPEKSGFMYDRVSMVIYS